MQPTIKEDSKLKITNKTVFKHQFLGKVKTKKSSKSFIGGKFNEFIGGESKSNRLYRPTILTPNVKQQQITELRICMFLDPLKHNHINLGNQQSDYLVKLSSLG